MSINMELRSNDFLPSAELSVIHFGFEHCKPGHSFGPRVRDYYLMHFVFSGKGTYRLDNRVYDIKANGGFMIFPGVTTLYAADRKEPWLYYWIGFKGSAAKAILNSCGITKETPTFDSFSHDIFKNYFTLLMQSAKSEFENEYMHLGYLYLLLSHLQASKQQDNTIAKKHMRLALQYIENNWENSLQVQQIADALFIDRSYLYRLFKENCGVSIKEYLISFCFSKANELLRFSSHSITNIALYCGFATTAAFGKAFKKKYGITPRQARKEFSLKQTHDF